MKGIPIILISLILAGGCIQSPAKVASGMPAVWTNVSREVDNITSPAIQNISETTFGNAAGTNTSCSIVWGNFGPMGTSGSIAICK
jgi:hypothetical protein